MKQVIATEPLEVQASEQRLIESACRLVEGVQGFTDPEARAQAENAAAALLMLLAYPRCLVVDKEQP